MQPSEVRPVALCSPLAGKFVDQRKRPFFPPSLGDLGGIPQVNPTTCPSTTRNLQKPTRPCTFSAVDAAVPLHDP